MKDESEGGYLVPNEYADALLFLVDNSGVSLSNEEIMTDWRSRLWVFLGQKKWAITHWPTEQYAEHLRSIGRVPSSYNPVPIGIIDGLKRKYWQWYEILNDRCWRK